MDGPVKKTVDDFGHANEICTTADEMHLPTIPNGRRHMHTMENSQL